MSDPLFVPHVTLDGIITVLSIVSGGIVFLVRVGNKLTLLGAKVEEHGTKIDKLTSVIEVQARHDERLLGLERRANISDERWDELRHGEGMVLPLERAMGRSRPPKPGSD